MPRPNKCLMIVLLALAVVAVQRPVAADDRQERVAAGQANAVQLLQLMDQDKNGKVSKQEFMNFMAAEFDRLDINKDGQLDVNELAHFRYRPVRRPGR